MQNTHQRNVVMKMDKEIHKIKNDLAMLKVFFTSYEDIKSQQDGEKLVKKYIKYCMNNINDIERLLKRIEKRNRQKAEDSNNRR